MSLSSPLLPGTFRSDLFRPSAPNLILIGIVTAMTFSAGAHASETIGKAETIENRVFGAIDGKDRTLNVPDAVHRDEMIRTEDKSQARIRFVDETDLRLGPKASIKLDAFVFSGKKDAAMELAAGSMRFVSGKGPKGSYLIKTPVATIGLRGTVVEVTIRNGRTYVSLHEGQAQVCTRSGRCMDLKDACTYLSVDRRGVTTPQPLSNRVPTYSGQCSGEFCVVDACTPQLSRAPAANPPAATPPPRAKPPKAIPPRGKRPPRARRPGRYVEEEIIIEEPEYIAPRRPRYPVDVYPGVPIDPGYVRPRGPRFPGGRPPRGTRPPVYDGDRPSRVPGGRGKGPGIRLPGGFDGGITFGGGIGGRGPGIRPRNPTNGGFDLR
jgi:hypothetical protein